MCNYPFNYTHNFEKDGAPISQPACITLDSATQKFTMTITAPSDVGLYTITSTATIPQNAFGTNTVLSTSYGFVMTVQHDCMITTITDRVINEMVTIVGDPNISQDITF